MKEIKWLKEEVISYLELKIIEDNASNEEMELYEYYKWNDKIKVNYTYKNLIKEMNEIYEG